MSSFIDFLKTRHERDSKVRATLRRSLAFTPGTFVPAYPYVEPFVKEADSHWRREAHYLVAGLWAGHFRQGRKGPSLSIGKASAAYMRSSNSESIERRFINLLDADTSQLPHRLRQMVSLLKEQEIDFDALLKGLLYWNGEEKRTQNDWARDFYRALNADTDNPLIPQEEPTQ